MVKILKSPVFQAFVIIWLVSNSFLACIGVTVEHKNCISPVKKAEFIMPGFRVGCYLGTSAFEEDK